MATPSTASPLDRERALYGDMEERTEPKFIDWKQAGTSVSGVLMKIERIGMEDGGEVSRYTVLALDEGQEYSFLGTYQLDQRIRPSDLFKRIDVRYEGEDQNIRRGENAMKVFRVRVWSKRLDPAQF